MNNDTTQDRTYTVEIQQLLARAHKGDTTVLSDLESILNDHPELWQKAGDLAQHAEVTTVQLIAGNNLFVRESLFRKLEEFKKDLAAPEQTKLEELLIARVAICWLQVHQADMDAASVAAEETDARRILCFSKRLDGAQQRYVYALKGLAALRRLQEPRYFDSARKPAAERRNHWIPVGTSLMLERARQQWGKAEVTGIRKWKASPRTGTGNP